MELEDSLSMLDMRRLYKDSDHYYWECPRKAESRVQQQFKAKLKQYLQMKRQKKFDPAHYKSGGFLTRRSVDVFNSLCKDDMNPTTPGKTDPSVR